jgi:hypothetical protein
VEKRKRFTLKQNLVCLCPICDIEMVNTGSGDFNHFICPRCGRDMGLVCDATIVQKELDEHYKLEKAKISRKK